jgi:protein arginine kinase
VLSYVISSRVRLARNLRNFRFPYFASDTELQTVSELFVHTIKTHPLFPAMQVIYLDELSPLERRVLEEKSLISFLLACQNKYRLAILPFKTPTESLLVNEEDHLRIQSIRPGLELKTAWNSVKKLDNCLQEKLDFAYSTHYGYLTMCPGNAGSGMRASVSIFVPALILLKRIIPLLTEWIRKGYTVRGFAGEGSESRGYVLQISNQHPREKNEHVILKDLESLCHTAITLEKKARSCLFNDHASELFDLVAHAISELQSLPRIDLTTGVKNLALYRLGVSLGLPVSLSGIKRYSKAQRERQLQDLDRLIQVIQPGHIHIYQKQQLQGICPGNMRNNSCENEDRIRAKLIQQELKIED